jgi:hypothetical protein
MSRVRAAKWEFFITRWSAIYDWVSGAAAAAREGAAAGAGARVSAEEVRRRDRGGRGLCGAARRAPPFFLGARSTRHQR